MKFDLKKVGIVTYAITFLVYLILVFVMNRNLGFGMGDLVYHFLSFGTAVLVVILLFAKTRKLYAFLFGLLLLILSCYLVYILTIGQGPEA